MNEMYSLFSRLCHPPIPRLVAVMLVILFMQPWSSPAFCGDIHDAASAGDMEKVKALLKDNTDLVFNKDNDGETPLHWAARNGKKDVVELLLANKAEVNDKDSNGETPLHWAASGGFMDMVKLLLSNKAEVNAKANSGWRALHWAVFKGHKDVVELLLANKAEVNDKDNNGWTPLHMAANRGFTDVVELLLSNMAEVNAKDNNGLTPLHMAANRGHKDVAELLLAKGADPNAKDRNGRAPLYAAASTGDVKMVELLRSKGADINAKDVRGWTPPQIITILPVVDLRTGSRSTTLPWDVPCPAGMKCPKGDILTTLQNDFEFNDMIQKELQAALGSRGYKTVRSAIFGDPAVANDDFGSRSLDAAFIQKLGSEGDNYIFVVILKAANIGPASDIKLSISVGSQKVPQELCINISIDGFLVEKSSAKVVWKGFSYGRVGDMVAIVEGSPIDLSKFRREMAIRSLLTNFPKLRP